MSRRAARFTEADIHRAGKVARKLGMIVEVGQDGVIRLIPSESVEKTERKVEPVGTIPL